MGLLKAAFGSVGSVLGDQWKDYFYCDALPPEVLAVKGRKRHSSSSSNFNGASNVISNGASIAVADGQCMCIVEQGKVVDICAEPGEYVYDQSTEPSIFYGDLGPSIKAVLQNVGKRFTYGGQAPKDQRVYYFNTKEILGNKYGTAFPVPFRVVDTRAAMDIDISVRCFGEYTFRLTNPILFYQNVCGNIEGEYRRENLESQMKSELLTALQPAFAKISALGVRYSEIPGHTAELAGFLKTELSAQWSEQRGIEIQRIGVSSIKASEEDEQLIKEMQRETAYMDPTRAAAHLVTAQSAAMKAAASNPNGAAMAFMGMNMAQSAGGTTAQSLFSMGQQNAATNAAAAPDNSWKCTCGAVTSGRFCSECGSPKPVVSTWICSCGAENTGNFCSECGSKKSVNSVCSSCGWAAPAGSVPKFCPECGQKF